MPKRKKPAAKVSRKASPVVRPETVKTKGVITDTKELERRIVRAPVTKGRKS